MIVEIDERTEGLIKKLLEIWKDSVMSTHLFLSVDEIEKIEKYVSQAIKLVEHLVIIKNKDDVPIGFMGIEGKKIEMLFIENCERGRGNGKKLLNYGIVNYNISELTVNEQNLSAKGFYEHLGFKVYKRSEIDEQGNLYPILYMRLEK